MGIGLRGVSDDGCLELRPFGEGGFGVSLAFAEDGGRLFPILFPITPDFSFLRVAFHFLEDLIQLLIGGLVIRMVGPVSLQEIFAHLKFFLDIGGDCIRWDLHSLMQISFVSPSVERLLVFVPRPD